MSAYRLLLRAQLQGELAREGKAFAALVSHDVVKKFTGVVVAARAHHQEPRCGKLGESRLHSACANATVVLKLGLETASAWSRPWQ